MLGDYAPRRRTAVGFALKIAELVACPCFRCFVFSALPGTMAMRRNVLRPQTKEQITGKLAFLSGNLVS